MAKSAARKMVDYRKRKRAQGLRQVTLWVPDWNGPGLHQRLKREADLLRDHPSTKEGDEFVEAVWNDLAAELERLERSKE